MQLHNINKGDKLESKNRVGRGGKRGKTSGHGHKGQKQHGRHGLRPEMRDFIKKLPKLRGFGKNRARTVNGDKSTIRTVDFNSLAIFKDGETVSPATIVEKGLLKKEGNKLPKVKILNNGDVKGKYNVEGCLVSASAKEVIEQVGGEVR